MIRKTIAFVVTLVAAGFAGYGIAWNSQLIAGWIAQLGGVVGLLLGALAIVLGLLATMWPQNWRQTPGLLWLHRLTILAALAVAAFLTDQLRSAFTRTPWLSLGILLGTVLVVAALWAFTVLDRAPGWLPAIRQGRPATALPATPAPSPRSARPATVTTP